MSLNCRKHSKSSLKGEVIPPYDSAEWIRQIAVAIGADATSFVTDVKNTVLCLGSLFGRQ